VSNSLGVKVAQSIDKLVEVSTDHHLTEGYVLIDKSSLKITIRDIIRNCDRSVNFLLLLKAYFEGVVLVIVLRGSYVWVMEAYKVDFVEKFFLGFVSVMKIDLNNKFRFLNGGGLCLVDDGSVFRKLLSKVKVGISGLLFHFCGNRRGL